LAFNSGGFSSPEIYEGGRDCPNEVGGWPAFAVEAAGFRNGAGQPSPGFFAPPAPPAEAGGGREVCLE